MTPYKPGDVILVAFPFTNFTTLKQRPAVIISSSAFNRRKNDVVAAAITSHLAGKPEGDEYALNPAEQRAAGLPKPSLVKTSKIVTLDQRLIRRRLGRLPSKSVDRILRILHTILSSR